MRQYRLWQAFLVPGGPVVETSASGRAPSSRVEKAGAAEMSASSDEQAAEILETLETVQAAETAGIVVRVKASSQGSIKLVATHSSSTSSSKTGWRHSAIRLGRLATKTRRDDPLRPRESVHVEGAKLHRAAVRLHCRLARQRGSSMSKSCSAHVNRLLQRDRGCCREGRSKEVVGTAAADRTAGASLRSWTLCHRRSSCGVRRR